MINLPEDDREALRILHVFSRNRINQDFIWLFEWIEKEQKRLERMNIREKDEVINRWQQGGLQLLNSLVELKENAPDLIDAYSEAVAKKQRS